MASESDGRDAMGSDGCGAVEPAGPAPSANSSLRRRWGRWLIDAGPAAVLVFAVRGYQVILGPFLGGHCRFQPSCSHYFIGAVKKHGPWRGAWRGTLRVLRCHPFHPGGYDPP
jgi:putative membrane protein insertion efficiency factor